MDVFVRFKQILASFGLEYFNKYYGNYKGFIEKNEDPKFLGRVQLRVPQIYGDEIPEIWAWSKGIFAGKQIGLFAIPNIGDGVWVEFENGDPRFPIWSYGWFSKGDVPDAAKNNSNKPTNMVWQSTTGQRIELDDTNSKVVVTQSDGFSIELSNTGILIKKDGGLFLKLSSSGIQQGQGVITEPMVLGQQLSTLIGNIITQAAAGITSAGGSAAGLTALAASISSILSADNKLS